MGVQPTDDAQKEFDDLFKDVLLDKEVRYLEDLDNHILRCVYHLSFKHIFNASHCSAPEVDGVMDEELQDDLLKNQYSDLPPLPWVIFTTHK